MEKKDADLLLQFTLKDCVAAEVKYHKSCYKKYTSILRNKTRERWVCMLCPRGIILPI
jgi:hypothetical protein